MAYIYPDFPTIERLHQQATEGEMFLLKFLYQNLSDDFEIFYQPFINGDRPDIIIVKKRGGIIIIEVKDWILNKYYIDKNTDWYLKENGAKIKSPLSQVRNYKDNMIDLHIEGLLNKSFNNKYYKSIINTVVYFHNEKQSLVKDFLSASFQEQKYEKYRKFIEYTECWGKDSLTKEYLLSYLKKVRLDRPSRLFDESLYLQFKRYLQPPYHTLEEGQVIHYTKEQQELIRSENRPRRKIKGIAGCGKTYVLAKRAVNAYIRTKGQILILTYNLSLKNYIRDRINDVREEFPWNNFYITNYHQFIKSEANNYGLEIRTLNPFEDVTFFNTVKDKIEKYNVIFIDEIQDYKTEWLEIITNYFLEEEGEFVVFGDEKQNIYNRPLDENNEPIIKTIRGDWNRSLNISRRSSDEIIKLALSFQKFFFDRKYTLDEFVALSNPLLDFYNKTIKYFFFNNQTSISNLYDKYIECVKEFNIHPSDIVILSSKIANLREFDFLIRNNLREKTETTFESKEEYDKLKSEFEDIESKEFKDKLRIIQRNKKNHFWMKTGTTKLSSIHSFKGWESHTIFLIIDKGDEILEFVESSEIIYTGITRAKVNLFIFNIDYPEYNHFFRSNLSN